MNGDTPAYPVTTKDGMFVEGGLTKRELFAAMAMQGLMEDTIVDRTVSLNRTEGHLAAERAVIMADLLIAELSKEP